MAYDKFKILSSSAVPVNIDNVDTDQIIPARFLKATERKGFGDNSFPLNNKNYKGKILVAGKNFGCGSSREHAVWAIYDYGFRAVVSSFFADIFKNNCLNIGVLPVQVSDSFLLDIFSEIDNDPNSIFEVNLVDQVFQIKDSHKKEKFKISVYKKSNMSNGFDDIDYLLNKKEEISTFANKDRY